MNRRSRPARSLTAWRSPAPRARRPSRRSLRAPARSRPSTTRAGRERQHLARLRALATPRRGDRGLELRLLAGLGLGAAVLDTRGADLGRPGDGVDPARPGVPVAGHEAVAVLVELAGEAGHVGTASASSAAANICWAPRRQISSSIERPSAPAVSLLTTLSMAFPSRRRSRASVLVLVNNRPGKAPEAV